MKHSEKYSWIIATRWIIGILIDLSTYSNGTSTRLELIHIQWLRNHVHYTLIFSFFLVDLKSFFFSIRSYWIRIIFKQMNLTLRLGSSEELLARIGVDLKEMVIKGYSPDLQNSNITIRFNLVWYLEHFILWVGLTPFVGGIQSATPIGR